MAVTVADLVAKLSLDVSGIDKGLADMQSRLGQVEKSVKSAGSSTDGIKRNFDNARSSSDNWGRSLYEVTHRSRLMTEQLVGELSPALGNVFSATTQAARGFQGFGVGAAAVAVGITAAIAVLGQYIAGVNEAAKQQAAFNIALRSKDTAGLTSQLRGVVQELEEFEVRSKFLIGRIINSFIDLGKVMTGQPLGEQAAARQRGGIAALAPFEAGRESAKNTAGIFGARMNFVEAMVGDSQQRDDLVAFKTQMAELAKILDIIRDANDKVAESERDKALAEAKVLELDAISIDTINKKYDAQLRINELNRDAAATALRAREVSGAGDIFTRREALTNPVTGGALPEGMQDPAFLAQRRAEITKPMDDYLMRLQAIRRESELMGGEFDKNAAELEAVKRAILTLDPAMETFSDRMVELKQRFADLQSLQSIKEVIGAGLQGLGSGVTAALNDMINGFQNVKQSFANIGRSIASSLIENVVNQGLKRVTEALNTFLAEVARVGLAKALGGILGSAAGGAAGSAAGGGGGNFQFQGGSEGFQHGGVAHGTGLAMLHGPEAVIPLRGGSVPVALTGGGGGGVIVNVITPPGHNAEVTDGRGPNGETVKNVVIRAIKQMVGNGEFDAVMATYGARRTGLTR